jgi:hypothetical protein
MQLLRTPIGSRLVGLGFGEGPVELVRDRIKIIRPVVVAGWLGRDSVVTGP